MEEAAIFKPLIKPLPNRHNRNSVLPSITFNPQLPSNLPIKRFGQHIKPISSNQARDLLHSHLLPPIHYPAESGLDSSSISEIFAQRQLGGQPNRNINIEAKPETLTMEEDLLMEKALDDFVQSLGPEQFNSTQPQTHDSFFSVLDQFLDTDVIGEGADANG